MKTKKSQWLLLFSILTLLFSAGFQTNDIAGPTTDKEADKDGLRLLSSGPRGISFHMAVPWHELEKEAVIEEGAAYTQLSLPGWESMSEPGAPVLPFRAVTLGVPPGVELSLKVTPGKSHTIQLDVQVIPGITQVIQDQQIASMEEFNLPQVTTEVKLDQDIYSTNGAYPGKLAIISNEGVLRGQRMAAIAVYPFQYNPHEKILSVYEEVTIEVQFSGSYSSQSFPLEDDAPVFESMLADTLLNYGEARFWRQPGLTSNTIAISSPTWEVPSEVWKIIVREEGFYRLSGTQLSTAGFPIDTLLKDNIQLINKGQEVALDVRLTPAGEVESITFNGQAIDSKYTDQNVYWLTIGTQPGLRMTGRTGMPVDAELAESYTRTDFFEGYLRYRSMVSGPDDFERFFLDYLQPSGRPQLVRTFTVQDLSSGTGKFRASLYGYDASSQAPDHHVVFYLNDVQIGETWFDGFSWDTREYTFDAGLIKVGENSIKVVSSSDPFIEDNLVLIDWFEIEFSDTLIATDEKFSFTNSTPQAWRYQVSGFSTSSAVDVYDITDPRQPVAITDTTFSDGTLAFQDEVLTTKTYSMLGTGGYAAPVSIVKDTSINLRDARQAKLILISHRDFLPAANRLATHRNGQGTNTFVVNVEEIYDEFNYGIISPYAIRDFLAYTQTHWTEPAPSYVLLIGDGHYDPKNYRGFGRTSYIPPFLVMTDPWIGETASDNRYVTFDGEGDRLPDMMIGRLSVNTNAEADALVTKIINYEALPPDSADWQNQVLIIADRDSAFIEAAEYLSDEYVAPVGFDVHKVYLGVAPYLDEASARAGVITNINAGKLFVDYIGHGGIRVWGSVTPMLLDVPAINGLSNAGMTPIVLGMTCWEGYFINPNTLSSYESLAELFTRKATGGALASWSASGLGLATGHTTMNAGFFEAYFNDGVGTLGEATIAGKLALWQTGYALDLIDTYHLFGDPSIVFNRGLTAVSDDYEVYENATLTVSAEDGVLRNEINPDGLPLTAQLVPNSGPINGLLDFHADGSFIFTPNPNWYGMDRFYYQAVTGNVQSNITMVNLLVKSTNQAPIAIDDSYVTLEDAPLIVSAQSGLLSNDADPDVGDLLSAYVFSTPTLGVLEIQTDGSFRYTPSPNVNGHDSFIYRVYDGQDYSEPATVTIIITPVNDLPIGVPDYYTTSENVPLEVPAPGTLTNDWDLDGDQLTAELIIGSGPTHGVLDFMSDSSFTYDPVPGYFGSDTFEYKTFDGTAYSEPVLVSITVEESLIHNLYLPIILR